MFLLDFWFALLIQSFHLQIFAGNTARLVNFVQILRDVFGVVNLMEVQVCKSVARVVLFLISLQVCVENFSTIREDCPLLILTRSFCETDGLSFTPPPENPLQASLNNAAGIATLAATACLVLLMFLLSCLTFMLCPNKCGDSPAWCCGACNFLFRLC